MLAAPVFIITATCFEISIYGCYEGYSLANGSQLAVRCEIEEEKVDIGPSCKKCEFFL